MRAGIYLGSFANEITSLKVQEVKVVESAKLATVPLENGMAAYDNRVKQPTQVRVVCKIHRSDADQAINALIKMYTVRTKKFLSVRDGNGIALDNLILKAMPFSRTPELYDLTIVELEFEAPIFADDAKIVSGNTFYSDIVSLGYVPGISSGRFL